MGNSHSPNNSMISHIADLAHLCQHLVDLILGAARNSIAIDGVYSRGTSLIQGKSPKLVHICKHFCSVYAIGLVVGTEDLTPKLLSLACILVIFGTVFDLLDGRVARMTNRFTEFGVQLDILLI